MPLLHEIMRALRPFLDELDGRRPADWPRPDREVHSVLYSVLMAEGVEVVTDSLRQEIGLPARGPDGWTPDELLAMEKIRLEIMSRPMPPVMWPPKPE